LPLLSKSEIEKLKAQSPVLAPVIEQEVKIPVDHRRFRMFHPDSTDRNPLSCSFDLDGEEIKIERGVASVEALTSNRLEAMGWIRGREITNG